jgi:hypothetical protein
LDCAAFFHRHQRAGFVRGKGDAAQSIIDAHKITRSKARREKAPETLNHQIRVI